LRIFTNNDLLRLKENIEIEMVADHGAIIPHINLDVVSVKPNVLIWQDFIRKRLASQTFTIYSNVDIEMFTPWSASKEEARIQIYVKDKISADIVCKCAILAVLGKSYESESLTVISKDSFETPT
jgi:hypothetical protein